MHAGIFSNKSSLNHAHKDGIDRNRDGPDVAGPVGKLVECFVCCCFGVVVLVLLLFLFF